MDSKRYVAASDFIPQLPTDGDKIESDAAELPNQTYLQDVRYVDAADILMAGGHFTETYRSQYPKKLLSCNIAIHLDSLNP